MADASARDEHDVSEAALLVVTSVNSPHGPTPLLQELARTERTELLAVNGQPVGVVRGPLMSRLCDSGRLGRGRAAAEEKPKSKVERTDDAQAAERRPVLETYERLLATLEVIAVEAERVGDAGIREWIALASLDAIEFAEEVGMLHDDEAGRRRQVIRARVQDVGRDI